MTSKFLFRDGVQVIRLLESDRIFEIEGTKFDLNVF